MLVFQIKKVRKKCCLSIVFLPRLKDKVMKEIYIQENPYEMKEYCPIVYTFDIIGQKWKIPIIWQLAHEEKAVRYNELKRKIPYITNIMLTKSLQELEEHQLICRKQYEVIPLKVEYSLSERGKSLLPILSQIYQWGADQIKLDSKSGEQIL